MKSWDELTHKEQLEATYWDAYKDAWGVRPRHVDTSSMTVAELESEIELLARIINENEKQREIDEQRASMKFEERILSSIAMGAKDRETAIRWIHEAEDTGGDDEYLCYTLGLPYGYFKGAVNV